MCFLTLFSTTTLRGRLPFFGAWLAAGGIPNGFEAPIKRDVTWIHQGEKNTTWKNWSQKTMGLPWRCEVSSPGVDFGVNELFFFVPPTSWIGSDFLFNWVMFSFKMWIFWGGMVHILQNGFSLTPSNLFLSQSVHQKIWNTMFSYVFQGLSPSSPFFRATSRHLHIFLFLTTYGHCKKAMWGNRRLKGRHMVVTEWPFLFSGNSFT